MDILIFLGSVRLKELWRPVLFSRLERTEQLQTYS